MDKKQIESAHFKFFRTLVLDFPEGEVWHEDAPDFLIHTEAGLMGVEHRQLFQQSNPVKPPLQARESQIDDILAIAQEHAELRGMPPVHITLFFSKQMQIGLNKKQRLELGREITRTLYKYFTQENTGFELYYSDCRRLGFPLEIDAVFLTRYDNHDQHLWRSKEAGETISDLRHILQCAIDAKAHKLQSYRKKWNLQACWLFIVAEGLQSSGFFETNELNANHVYTSSFDRTYFLNYNGPPPIWIKLKTKI